mgnify:CR=1 FL=1
MVKKVKLSIILYVISVILLIILILPYIQLVPQSVIGVEIGGVKVFAGDLSERNAVLIFLVIVSAIAGFLLQKKRH